MAFGREPAAAIVGAITFSPLFWVAAQVRVQRAAVLLVRPDLAVDALVADRGDLRHFHRVGDLLRAPLKLKQHDHRLPNRRVDSQVASGSTAPPAGATVSLEWSVETIVFAAVALQLAADGAGVPVEDAGDAGLAIALPVQPA